MAEGSEIEVSAPTGNFYLIDPTKRNIFISGGVGLTPMIAMLNQLVTLDMPQPVSFIHACRSSHVHAMKKHIHELQAKYPRLSTFTAYEAPHQGDVLGEDYDVAGRLDLATMDAALLPVKADYYLCGPMPFMAEQQKALVARGIPAENIHSEAFGTGGVHH